MNRFTDQVYLQTEQYRTASNLNARQQLHARFSTNPENWFHWVFDQAIYGAAGLPEKARILEVGCGPADLWVQNRERLGRDWEITLSDFSPGMVAEAKRLLFQSKPAQPQPVSPDASLRHAYRFCVIDAQHIPFPPAYFDLVFANHCLYHIPDLNQALAEIWRVLRPGGRLLAATNGQGHLLELYELVNRFQPGCGDTQVVRLGFNLENGMAYLSPKFSVVSLHRHEDALYITQAEPLLAYLLSMGNFGDLNGDALRDQSAVLHHFLEAELLPQGAIHISKDAGLFMAIK